MSRSQITDNRNQRSILKNQWRAIGSLAALTLLLVIGASAADISKTNLADLARSGVKSGAIAFKLTTPEELQDLLGKPERQGWGDVNPDPRVSTGRGLVWTGG